MIFFSHQGPETHAVILEVIQHLAVGTIKEVPITQRFSILCSLFFLELRNNSSFWIIFILKKVN